MAAPVESNEIVLQKIKYFAILSRLSVIVLQILFNTVFPDHDAKVFNPGTQVQRTSTGTILDHLVKFLLGGLSRWDGVYFTHIAEYGYTYENTLAFFPLFPLFIRSFANTVLLPMQFVMSFQSIIFISSVLVNSFIFVKTAETLFELGKLVTCNDKIAYTASLLFCINPASVFMSAVYSECIFSYLTVTALLKLEEGRKLMSAIYIGFTCLTRSNGLLNLGYLLYVLVKNALQTLRRLYKAVKMNMSGLVTVSWIYFSTTKVPYSILMIISVLPFVIYQYYCYQLYCTKAYTLEIPDHIIQYARTNGLKLPNDTSSVWCNDSLPLAYSYIQSHYWEQGFLRYWKLIQIPNFLLAAPVIILVCLLAFNYYNNNRYICHTLGLDEAGAIKKETQSGPLFKLEGIKLLPYVIHASLLMLFGLFFIHVQVLTRLLFSSTPVLYWYAAHLLLGDIPKQKQYNKYDLTHQSVVPVEKPENLSKPWKNIVTNCLENFTCQHLKAKFVIVYFLSYFVVGTALFSNFLPWT